MRRYRGLDCVYTLISSWNLTWLRVQWDRVITRRQTWVTSRVRRTPGSFTCIRLGDNWIHISACRTESKLNQTLDLSFFFEIKKRQLKAKGESKGEPILCMGSVILYKIVYKSSQNWKWKIKVLREGTRWRDSSPLWKTQAIERRKSHNTMDQKPQEREGR